MMFINSIYNDIIKFYETKVNNELFLSKPYTPPMEHFINISNIEEYIKDKYAGVNNVLEHKFVFGIPGKTNKFFNDDTYSKYVLFIPLWLAPAQNGGINGMEFISVGLDSELKLQKFTIDMKEKPTIIFDCTQNHSVVTDYGMFGVSVWFTKNCGPSLVIN